MKHIWWLLGASGGIEGATLHAYGPDYGAGMAVMEFAPVPAPAVATDGPVAARRDGSAGAGLAGQQCGRVVARTSRSWSRTGP